MDPDRLAQSLSLTGCSLRRGHDRYLTEPLRSIQEVRTSRHLDAIMPFHLGGTSWIYVHDSIMDLDGQCYMFDDRWFHVARFLTCSASDAHTGAYFPFQMRFMDLHLCRMIDDR